MFRIAALSALLGFALTGAAVAQAGCVLDNCADKKPVTAPVNSPATLPPAAEPAAPANSDAASSTGGYRPRYGGRPAPRGSSVPGDFDFYVLSLSWSSGFCATGGAEKARRQCSGGSNLGFVVHGLWPQYERGFPSDCGPAGRSPSRIALEGAQGLFPDEGLARYEWRKHGTCSGKSPTDYYADVRRARDAVVVPPPFKSASVDQTWNPVDIARAFEASNPRLRPGMIAIGCRSGVLQEVRVCMSKDLRDFRACPEVAQQTCRTREVRVPAPL